MKRLYRSQNNKIIGGICGGIGDYFEIDPVLIRLIWGILFFFGGVGFLAYIVAWIIVPEDSSDGKSFNNSAENKQTPVRINTTPQIIIGILLILAGALLLTHNCWYFNQVFRDVVRFSWKYGIPVVLIGFGIYLIFEKNRSKTDDK